MAIIYTYPTKATPNDNDLILISDSEDSNKTKQVKISTLPGGSGSGVSSVTAVLPLASTGGSTPAISLTGLTGFGTTGQVIKVNSNADGLEWGAAGGGTPDGSNNEIQFNNSTAFGASENLTFSGSPTRKLLSVTNTVEIKGDGADAGKLKLYCPNLLSPHAVTIEGPAHPAVAYTLKMPATAPGDRQILEYSSSGNLGWINTPSGGSGAPGGSDTQMQYNNGGAFEGTTGLTWDDSANILSIATRYEGDINGALLQKVIVKEVGGVSKGDIVYISGGTGDNPEVKKARANASITMPALGIMKANTAENATGECVTSGEITGLNLTGFTTGDELFVSSTTAGVFQTSAPTGEANLIQKIGKVIKGGTGGALTVLGAFRTNATPNLNQGSLFIGNASDQATTLSIGGNNTVLTSNGTTATWDTPTNTNIANTNLQLNNNRTLDFNFEGADKSLTFINTNGGSKNLFKFDQVGGASPKFTVGHTESAYEGTILLEGNGSNRTGQLQFENAAGTYYTSFQAPTTFGANQNIYYTLPNLQGVANSVLTNNGSGALSWTTTSEPTEITSTTALNSTTFANTPFTFASTNAGSGIGAPLATQVASQYGNKHISFYLGTTFSGAINQAGSNTVNYAISSDYRLKENVVEMTGAVNRVKQLNPSRFNFIADGPSRTVDGFLAHEVYNIVPEAITGSKDAVDTEGNIIPQGIDQSKLVPLLVGAIKELTARIEALEA